MNGVWKILFACAMFVPVVFSAGADGNSLSLSARGSWTVMRKMPLPKTGLVQTPHNVVAFMNDHYGIMAGDWGETWYTRDGGADWTRGEGDADVPGHRYGVEILDASHAWSCGHRGDVGYSDDGGMTWKRIAKYGGAERESCRYLSFADSRVGWIASTTLLGATTDGGHTWRDVALPEGIGAIAAISCTGDNAGFVFDADGKGTLWFTADGGKKWTRRVVGLEYRCYPVLDIDTRSKVAMRFTDRNRGMIVLNCAGRKVYTVHTEDGGAHFTGELLPVENGGLYLSADCAYLTVCGFGNIVTVMRRDP